MLRVIITVIVFAIGAASQDAPSKGWEKADKQDPLRGTQYVQYSLEGEYLTPPRNAAAGTTPSIILRCTPGRYAHGLAHGKLLDGYIFVGGVVDAHVGSDASIRTTVEYRLDDGKLQTYYWNHSTDYSSLFFSDIDLGHMLAHKENTNPQIRKIVLGVPEFLGIEVVMQFDMPDASEVGDTCGVIWHKRDR